MFKGLRSKIENEQRGQESLSVKPVQSLTNSTPDEESKRVANLNRESVLKTPAYSVSVGEGIGTNQDRALSDTTKTKEHSPTKRLETKSENLDAGVDVHDRLRQEIIDLNERLNSVIREKEDSNEQNAQLYQLIEKLRRNLESEKEINSSLTSRIQELENKLKDTTITVVKAPINSDSSSLKSISIKPFASLSTDPTLEDDIDTLKLRLCESQNQISEKNRQLRIKQQNLNDIKKALQKEIAEHNLAKEELETTKQLLNQRTIDESYHQISSQNGSINCDLDLPSDRLETKQSQRSHDTTDEDLCGESHLGLSTQQIDAISHESRSSASVDDFDPNDIQHSSNSREINHEYLKNVLFRYMTSTDTETSHHLVRALTVIMNFSSEQSAAIKSAMHAKSSWLRLK